MSIVHRLLPRRAGLRLGSKALSAGMHQRTGLPTLRLGLRHSSSDKTGQVQKQGFFRRTYYRNGKLSRTALGVTLLILWGFVGMGNAYSMYYNRNDPRVILASIVAKSLLHIDRNVYASIDFSSFEETMNYFKWHVMVSEWAMQYPGRLSILFLPSNRGHLTLEDFAQTSFKDRVEDRFAKILAMPEGQAKHRWHTKVRLACQDIHRFLQDFNSYTEEEIERVLNKTVHEMSQEERMMVSGIGLGTNMLIKVTWWSSPV